MELPHSNIERIEVQYRGEAGIGVDIDTPLERRLSLPTATIDRTNAVVLPDAQCVHVSAVQDVRDVLDYEIITFLRCDPVLSTICGREVTFPK